MAYTLFYMVRSLFLISSIFLLQCVLGNERCYNCRGVSDLIVCNDVQTCGPNEKCYTKRYTTQGGLLRFDVGCMSLSTCKVLDAQAALIGRRDLTECFKCCSGKTADGNLCNSDLCSNTHMATGMKKCYSCQDVSSPDACYTTKTCYNGEQCSAQQFMQTSTHSYRYNLGCYTDSLCGVLAREEQQRPWQTTPGRFCILCCNGTLCNRQLCKNVTVTVPSFTSKPHDVTASIGSVITLQCATDTSSHAALQWAFQPQGSSSTKSQSQISGATFGPNNEYIRLTISGSSAGSYTCTARNSAGSSSATATITVRLSPPVFTVKPINKIVYVEDTIRLHCKTATSSHATLSWRFRSSDGRHGTTSHIPGARYGSHNEYIEIPITTHSAGTYTCVASNTGGSTYAVAHLTVHNTMG